MLDDYGVIIYKDIKNNCFVASASELSFCQVIGSTRVEALEILEQEIEAWRLTKSHLMCSSTSQKEIEFEEAVASGATSENLDANNHYESLRIKIDVQYKKSFTLMTVEGEVDIYNCSILRAAIQDAVQIGRKNLLIDFAKVPYMDSVGYATLLTGLRLLKPIGKRLAVTNVCHEIARILCLTRLDSLIYLASSVEDANKRFADMMF